MNSDEFGALASAIQNQNRVLVALSNRLMVPANPVIAGQNTQKTTRLGRSEIFTNPGNSLAFFTDGSGEYGRGFAGKNVRMVDVNESDELSKAPGSWVLTFGTKDVVPGLQGAGDVLASNLVAKIGFGSGGVSQYVEVDANYGTVILPSQTVWAEVGHEPFMPVDAYAFPAPNKFFQSITSVVTVCKSSQSCGEARRSYWVGGATGVNVPIPPFAIAWAYMPFGVITAGFTPATIKILSASAAGLDAPVPEIVESMGRTHCFRELPPNSEGGTLQFTPNAPAATTGGQIVFKLLLGNF